jgi:hypothetical protein
MNLWIVAAALAWIAGFVLAWALCRAGAQADRYAPTPPATPPVCPHGDALRRRSRFGFCAACETEG